jgi:hypothetical protein
MERQTISSASTFWIKFVLPALWIPGFGFSAFILWFGLARGKYGELPPTAMKYLFAIIWVLGTTFISWTAIRLKRVQLAFWSKHPVVAELQRVAGLLPDSAV